MQAAQTLLQSGTLSQKKGLPRLFFRARSIETIPLCLLLLLLFNTTRTTSGPPSTGAAIAMDGGVADTQPAITQAVSRRRF